MKPYIQTTALAFEDILFYPDLKIPSQKVTFLSGPSGCGKSTLFKLFTGILSPSCGTIFFEGNNISDMDKIILRRKILLVNQAPYLFPGTIRDNYKIFHQYHESDCPSSNEIETYLHLCCMNVSPDSSCVSMSGGERQRVFLSLALSMHPSVLLLDEPTSALNRELSYEVIQNIIDFSKINGITLLVISHDESLKSDFAENVIELFSPQKGTI